MKYGTIREAAEAWVHEFNAIPQSVVEKLIEAGDEIDEVTPPAVGDYVIVTDYADYRWQHGEIVRRISTDEDLYLIRMDSDGKEIEVYADDFEVEHDGSLPMWGTMWAFGDTIDNDWLDGTYCESGLQTMADCGFRIYTQEDYGYIFGIDGAGYDFYEDHWIPLYKARGLHWHKEEEV